MKTKSRGSSKLLAVVLAVLLACAAPCGAITAEAAAVTDSAVSSMVNVAKSVNGSYPGSLGLPSSNWCGRFVGYCINHSEIASQLGTIPNESCNLALSLIGWVCKTKDAGQFYVFSESHRNRLNEIYSNFDSKMTFCGKDSFTPRAGDIVEFTWDSWSTHSFSHVGIVTGVSGSTITYIDGNSSSGNGRVASHTMSKYSNYIYGFIRFHLSGNVVPDPYPVLQYGSKGSAVRDLQTKLNAVIGSGIAVDGDFGPATKKAVEDFQGQCYLSINGICDSETWKALNAAYASPSGTTTKPVVWVDGEDVTVSWSYSGSAQYVEVCLIQEPWGWPDVKDRIHVFSLNYCTFTGVKPGYYRVFTVARPNYDGTQSAWTEFTVKPPHTTHTWDNGTVTKPSTEEEEGIMTYTCTECGVTKTEAIVRLPHLEHRWDEGVVVTEPTETEPGLKRYTCLSPVCNETMDEIIPALSGEVPPDPTPENSFIDVPNGAYFAKAVDWALENGITAGTSKTTFSPNAVCTRAQAVAFLWRYAGSPEPARSASHFTDVAKGSYYEKAVLWAEERGITGGVSANRFAPNDPCTRAQIVSFLYRMKGSPAVNGVSPFLDVPQSLYYSGAVAWAVENGVTMGTSASRFSPHNDCSRGQIVTFLYRVRQG